MKSIFFWIGWMSAALAGGSVLAAPLTPKELLDQVDDLYRGQSAHGTMNLKVVTERWSREMKAEFWAKGKDQSLVRILAPTKEKGTATLKSKENIWNYLPKVNRVIKIPSSMMGGSWMGSHFTNDDLVKESRMTVDFEFQETFAGKREGPPVHEITCTPKPGAAVVWGKLVVQIEQQRLVPVWIQYYDEDMKLARTLTFSDVQKLGARLVPFRSRMLPADKPKEFTEISYEQMRFDVPLGDDVFTLQNLQR